MLPLQRRTRCTPSRPPPRHDHCCHAGCDNPQRSHSHCCLGAAAGCGPLEGQRPQQPRGPWHHCDRCIAAGAGVGEQVPQVAPQLTHRHRRHHLCLSQGGKGTHTYTHTDDSRVRSRPGAAKGRRGQWTRKMLPASRTRTHTHSVCQQCAPVSMLLPAMLHNMRQNTHTHTHPHTHSHTQSHTHTLSRESRMLAHTASRSPVSAKRRLW